MDDAVARYRAASEANDMEGVMSALSPDAELVSPISGRMVFRGTDDLRVLLTAVYGSMTGLQWREELGAGNVRVIMGDADVGPVRMADAMVLRTGGRRAHPADQAAPAPVAGSHAPGPEARAEAGSPAGARSPRPATGLMRSTG